MPVPMAKVSRRKFKRERFERRFVPRSTVDPRLIALLGALGAAALGAGFYGQWGGALRGVEQEPVAHSTWILAAGALLVGAAIWIGTSGETIVRVGSAGVGEEKSGNVRRIPWHALESVKLEGDVLVVTGEDDAGAKCSLRVRQASAPQAVAWIVGEASARVPDAVELSEEESERVGEPAKKAGEWVEPPPLQVVGRHCAVSEKVIAYEPDARVCQRCERVYHRAHVPKTCACGGSLAHLEPKEAEAS